MKRQQTKKMMEYDLYVPLYSNKGKRMARSGINDLKQELIARFGGLTYFPQVNKGAWRLGNVTFRDELVILQVLCEDKEPVRKYWRQLKKKLKARWNQKDVLILIKDVTIL